MRRRATVLLAVLILNLAIGQAAPAQVAGAEPSVTYAIPWWTVNGGGGTSVGGAYRLSGTSGQPDSSNARTCSSPFNLMGGFWARGQTPRCWLRMPLIRRH